tara:strand:- start:1189 stop:1395 length:207 start_codon:yes stop_codon:yes gene_type:complete
MKAGDIVRIRDDAFSVGSVASPLFGAIGVIVKEARRLYIPAAKVMVGGEILEFDLEELDLVSRLNRRL